MTNNRYLPSRGGLCVVLSVFLGFLFASGFVFLWYTFLPAKQSRYLSAYAALAVPIRDTVPRNQVSVLWNEPPKPKDTTLMSRQDVYEALGRNVYGGKPVTVFVEPAAIAGCLIWFTTVFLGMILALYRRWKLSRPVKQRGPDGMRIHAFNEAQPDGQALLLEAKDR